MVDWLATIYTLRSNVGILVQLEVSEGCTVQSGNHFNIN